jgi:two-component system sensor histidine kinase CpxA
MRSLFAKILVWFWVTLAITVVGSAFISALSVNENDYDTAAPASRLVTFQLEEARSAWEIGGRPGLEAFMDTVNHVYKADGVLTDEEGRDLLTNQDRSDLVAQAKRRHPFLLFRIGNTTVARSTDDGKYWFFFTPHENVGSWFLAPEHIFVMGVGVLLCYWLAFHLTSPVRSLHKALDRFGRGDLSARVGSTRRDELGRLAGAFDRMAGRIETLLNAERKLLLDISHELRSPLARLGVAVELARSGDDLDSALNRIQKESDRLNDLVGQLLQVTRAEGDPSSLRRDPIRLDSLIEQMVDDSRIEAESHGCGLKFETREPVIVEGDPELLRRTFENVIRNAIRHSPANTDVEVTLARNDAAAVINVRDHGTGVPEGALPRLFDPFYRVEADRNRTSGGIGLGLSIARRAIELHKGSIRASNAHPGLIVHMELPGRAASEAASGSRS